MLGGHGDDETEGRGPPGNGAAGALERAAGPRAPAAQRRRRVRPPRGHRRGRRRGPDDPPPGRPGPGRQPALDGQAVRAHGAPAGRRPPGVRPHDRRAGDHGVQPLGRGPPRPHDPGDVPPDRDPAGRPRDRRRGDAARRPDGRPPRPRRRAPRPAPPHVLRAALGVHPAREARRLGAGDLLAGGPPGPRRLPGGRRRRLRGATRPPRDRHRRLRDPDLRLPAAGGRAVVRDPRRPGGHPGRRPARGHRPPPHGGPRRDDRLPGARRRDPRPARYLAHEGGRRQGRLEERHGGAARRRDPARRPRRGDAGVGHRDQDRGRRRLRAWHVVRERRGAPPGGRAGRARRCASCRATTTRRCSIRTGASPARPCRRSSSRPSASSPADGRRRTDHGLPGRPVPDPRDHVRGVAQRDPVGLSPAREAVPPRRRRRARAAPVPRDPGGLRAARRRRGPAAIRGRRPVAPGPAAEARLARRVAGTPQRPQAGLGPAGRRVARRCTGPAGGAGAGSARRTAERRRRARARRGAAAPPEPPQGHARIHARYDEAAETPFEPEWDGGSWYGHSMGTYWTINPREYADPRKHGPEYLARARRAFRGDARGDEGRGRARRRRRPRSSGPPPTPRPSRSPAPGPGRGAARRPRGGDTADWAARAWTYDSRDPGGATWTPRGEPPRRTRAGTPPRRWRRRPCPTSRPCSGSASPDEPARATPGATG